MALDQIPGIDVRNTLGAEIGVFRGATSAALLRRFPNLMLYLVDPYNPMAYLQENDQCSKASNQDHAENRRKAEEAVRFAADRARFVPHPSPEATANVPYELDFVFIDGDHCYDAVTADLNAWGPKIKENGLIAGHDYNRPDVARAVTKYATERKIEVSVGLHNVWWIPKKAA